MRNILIMFLFIPLSNFAQLKGKVFGIEKETKKPIFAAKIKLLQAKTGVITDDEGYFEIVLPKKLPDTLIISAFGYHNDTIIVDKKDRFGIIEVTLYNEQLMQEIIVEAKKSSHSISRLKVFHVEEIGQDELKKAACCNLSESFETNASVDVNIPDGISGARKIQMMGLDGVYTQLQMENIPYLRGLESSYGLSSMSGTWIESIQITKGTGTVVNGYESMAGLINFELKKPTKSEKFFANVYGNIFGRAEVNLNASHLINKRWSTAWFLHGAGMFGEIDHNHDGFKDLPQSKTISALNRWSYQGKKMEAQFGLNAYWDDKRGGQLKKHKDTLYQMNMLTKHIDVFAKTGFFTKKPYQSFGIVYNLKYQTNQGLVGLKTFDGEEKRAYVNGMYENIIGSTLHKYKAGLSFVGLEISQKTDSNLVKRIDYTPGAFLEYTYTGLRWVMVLGNRVDYHQQFGWQYTPRMHHKFILTENTDLRLTVGKGWRIPNYMIDNFSLLAVGRAWQKNVEIKPEISWNFGGSIVHDFFIKKRKLNVSLDYYFTYFTNQLVVDRDENIGQITFTNLKNTSYSNVAQIEISWDITKQLTWRLAYKYIDVKTKYANEFRTQVMVPRHRIFTNVSYKTKNKRWLFDATVSLTGNAALPQRLNADSTIVKNELTPFYPYVLGQITYVFKQWEFYVGGENLTNFKQKNPIIDVENPFGKNFDATRIWGPVMGINIYVGFRFSINTKNEKK